MTNKLASTYRGATKSRKSEILDKFLPHRSPDQLIIDDE